MPSIVKNLTVYRLLTLIELPLPPKKEKKKKSPFKFPSRMKWLRIKVMLGCGFITITPDSLQAFVIESKDREMEAEKQAIKAYSSDSFKELKVYLLMYRSDHDKIEMITLISSSN